MRGPRFLYKYFSFDVSKELEAKKVRDALVASELYLASPSDFNDPFDFRAQTEKGEPAVVRRYLEKKARQEHGRRAREMAISNFSANLLKPNFLNEAFDRIANAHGVVCLCGNPRSIPMWSHYANSHFGLCLQFECSEDMELFPLARSVEYRTEFPKLRYPEDLAGDSVVNNIIFRKFAEWAYEDEFRYVESNAANHRLPYKSDALSGIILGYRFSSNSLASLEQMISDRLTLGHRPPRIYRADRCPDDYRIQIRRSRL